MNQRRQEEDYRKEKKIIGWEISEYNGNLCQSFLSSLTISSEIDDCLGSKSMYTFYHVTHSYER